MGSAAPVGPWPRITSNTTSIHREPPQTARMIGHPKKLIKTKENGPRTGGSAIAGRDRSAAPRQRPGGSAVRPSQQPEDTSTRPKWTPVTPSPTKGEAERHGASGDRDDHRVHANSGSDDDEGNDEEDPATPLIDANHATHSINPSTDGYDVGDNYISSPPTRGDRANSANSGGTEGCVKESAAGAGHNTKQSRGYEVSKYLYRLFRKVEDELVPMLTPSQKPGGYDAGKRNYKAERRGPGIDDDSRTIIGHHGSDQSGPKQARPCTPINAGGKGIGAPGQSGDAEAPRRTGDTTPYRISNGCRRLPYAIALTKDDTSVVSNNSTAEARTTPPPTKTPPQSRQVVPPPSKLHYL